MFSIVVVEADASTVAASRLDLFVTVASSTVNERSSRTASSSAATVTVAVALPAASNVSVCVPPTISVNVITAPAASLPPINV